MLKGFPSNSGDMNPIENIWHLLKLKLKQLKSKTLEELKINAEIAWREIQQDIIQRLILSMPNRLNSLIKNFGSYTKY